MMVLLDAPKTTEHRPTWTTELIAKLKELWVPNELSATEIAGALGGGISKSAVIGKANRLGLPSHSRKGTAKPRKPRQRKLWVLRQRSERPPRPTDIFQYLIELSDGSPGVPLVDLNNEVCHWPIGDWEKPATLFCGRQRPKGELLPYCEGHCRIAVVSDRRRRAGHNYSSISGHSRVRL